MLDNTEKQTGNSLSHEEKVELFKQTVLDVIDDAKPVLFLDTEKILALDDTEARTEEAMRQVQEQSPEIYNKILSLGEEQSATIFENMGASPNKLTAGAYYYKGFDDVAVLTTPSTSRDEVTDFIDSKDPILNSPIDVDKFPATDAEMIMYNAAHEAAHAKIGTYENTKDNSLEEKLASEAYAEGVASAYLAEQGNDQIGPAYEQIRALEHLLHGNVEAHATAGLSGQEEITQSDLDEIAQTRQIMDKAVDDAGEDSLGLLLTDPQRYAEVVREALIEDNPLGLKDTQLQKIEVLNSAIDTYLGPSFDIEAEPEIAPEETASIDTEIDKGYTQGVNGGAFLTLVDKEADQPVNAVFQDAMDNRSPVVTDIFSSNVNPPEDSITMVDARIDQPAANEAQFSEPAGQENEQESTLATQSL